MTQLSYQRRTRILSSTSNQAPDLAILTRRERQQRDILAHKCRVIFDRIYPQLVTDFYNWHIAIDPDTDTEDYLTAPTFTEIADKIKAAYPQPATVRLTIFRLNETGTCGYLL